MRSREIELDSGTEPRSEAGVLYRLLDPLFGLFVWAIHFLIVYAGAAVACVLRADADPAQHSMVLAGLVGITLLAAAIVVAHGLRTWRHREPVLDNRFLIRVTVGHDALAAVAILWQLLPILMAPLCR